MGPTIKTDHKWKNFKYRDEVPARVLANQFDYLDDDTYDGFILYRRTWYHVSDFMRIESGDVAMKGWHGYASDSYFSGALIRLSDDGEQYQIGAYYS